MFCLVEYGQIILCELAIVGSTWLALNIDYSKIASNMDPRLVGMRALYQYSKSRTQWQKYWSESYNNNCITKLAIDSLNYSVRFVYSKWQNVRLEPLSTQWLSKCVLSQDPEQLKVTVRDEGHHQVFFGCMFYETFHGNEDWSWRHGCAQETFALECTMRPTFAKVGDLEMLMLMKSDGYYLSRIGWIVGDRQEDLHVLSWEPSSVRFLSVEYRNPAMDGSISLNIDKGYYLEGNHLLSSAFVRRCLEYQCSPKSYYFDMNYTLSVMDNEINMIELKSSQYVVLEKDLYRLQGTLPLDTE